MQHTEPAASLLRQAKVSPVTYKLTHLTLRGWQSGAATGTPVLCLHGWLDNANSFLPLAAEMLNVHMLAIDLPGHGLSSHRSPEAHYYLFEYIADLVELIQQQAWSALTIIGHSMGGMIASALAAAMPELVARLVLVDSIGFVTTPEVETASQLRQAILSREGRRKKFKPSYPSLADAAKARQHQSDFAELQARLLTQRGCFAVSTDPLTYGWTADMRLREASAQRLCVAQAKGLLRQISCPVLALMAEDGIALMQQNLLLYQQCFTTLTVRHAPGGHHLHMTQPQAIAAVITDFLAASDVVR